jgi:hypothetical protein
MNGLILLSSYPKSGNTWLRAVIESLTHDGAPIDINSNPAGTLFGSNRQIFDHVMGIEASDLTADEIAELRPKLWETLARDIEEPLWIKSHDALLPAVPAGPLPYPVASVRSVVYIVRDPRDVAISFSHHFNVSLDEAIEAMADPATSLDSNPTSPSGQLPQLISSWSRHAESWLDASGLALHQMRYEDMHAAPAATFAEAARFLDIAFDAEKMTRAIRAGHFDSLRAQEITSGFRERESREQHFFRQGAAGGWREILNADQIRRIERDHGPMMTRLGYLP